MKLAITLILAGTAGWYWLISNTHMHSTSQWVAAIILLLMCVWPGLMVWSQARHPDPRY